MSPESLTLSEAASEIRQGKLSPLDYVQAIFARIDKVEPRIRAWVTLNRDAVLAEARQCEAEARQKKFRGPLHGIPVGIKDIFHTKGLLTTAGSRLFENFVPEQDARAVAQLKKAGAITLGKCVTTEFAMLDPGPTRNPWNIAHTPGGSSSGSAAAVASRMCPVAIGSQTIGSIGRPAAFCGVVALMPTQSRVSRAGAFPAAWSLDHVGPFGRSVQDVELLLEAMAETPIQKASPAPRIRIGVIRDFFYAKATQEARTLNDTLVNKLADAKFEVGEAQLPPIFEVATAALRTIIRAELASVHEALYTNNPESYGRKLRAFVETGTLIEANEYLRALRIRRQYRDQMAPLFQNFDVLLTPGAPGTAPEGLSSTGDPVLNGPWTFADFPTLSLPHSLASNGLPTGIQLTAPPLQEGLLLEIGKALEEVIGFKAQPVL